MESNRSSIPPATYMPPVAPNVSARSPATDLADVGVVNVRRQHRTSPQGRDWTHNRHHTHSSICYVLWRAAHI
jgi:hypothetical protein